MQPRSVRTEQHFVRASTTDGLDDVVETTNASPVGIHVGQPHQLIHYLLLRSPIGHETAQVRHDKVHMAAMHDKSSTRYAWPTPIAQRADGHAQAHPARARRLLRGLRYTPQGLAS